MEKKYIEEYINLEKKGFWFKARRELILGLIKNNKKDIKILDIGCAGGVLLKELKKYGFLNLYGIDIEEKFVKLSKKICKNIFLADAGHLPFKDDYFDIIIASDILEHLKNDKKALKEWCRVLKNGGKIIFGVPAFNILWSYHDIINCHKKRYRKKDIFQAVPENLKVVKLFYWNMLFFIPTLFYKLSWKVFNIKKTHVSFFKNKRINRFLTLLMKIENLLILKLKLFPPLGVSLIGVLKKI